MKKEFADKWVEALRSGRYKQARGALRTDKGYCCLGVLCDIAEVEWQPPGNFSYKYRADENCGLVPWSVMQTTGLKHDAGDLPSSMTIGDDLYTSLAGLNDDAGYSFDQIADVVEKHWEEL